MATARANKWVAPGETNRSLPAVEISTPGSVPALDRALDILERLSASSTGLTLSALSSQLDLPKNAVFRITQTLLARGYLSRDPGSLEFRLTSQMLRLSSPSWDGLSLSAISRESMTELRDQTRETVQLGVLSGLEGVVIEQVESPEPLRIVVDIGLRFPLHNNAPGKLLLAAMSPERRDAVLSQIDLEPSTSRTITSASKLRHACERIVSAGYSTDHGEADEGIHCVAASIVDTHDRMVGVLWVTGPAKRLPKSRFRELGAQVIETGDRISRRIRKTR